MDAAGDIETAMAEAFANPPPCRPGLDGVIDLLPRAMTVTSASP